MAAPTPTIDVINWDGTRGGLRWLARWTAGAPDNFADQNLVNLDADLAPVPTSVKIRTLSCRMNGNLLATFEFDATTDQIIDQFEGQSDTSVHWYENYTDFPNVGIVPSDTGAPGFNGDIILTTSGAADGDELAIVMTFERSA